MANHISQSIQMKIETLLLEGGPKPICRSLPGCSWLACLAMCISGCAPATETMPGKLHLKLEEVSNSDTTFILSNDSEDVIQIRGERMLSRTVRAWPLDVRVACQMASGFMESEGPNTADPSPDDINVRPGERVRIAVQTKLPQNPTSQRCLLRVVLKDGNVVGPLEFFPKHTAGAASQ